MLSSVLKMASILASPHRDEDPGEDVVGGNVTPVDMVGRGVGTSVVGLGDGLG